VSKGIFLLVKSFFSYQMHTNQFQIDEHFDVAVVEVFREKEKGVKLMKQSKLMVF